MTKTFDQAYRLTDLDAGSLQSLDYTLNAVGNITAITDNLDPARNQTFGYDDLDRLTSATGVYGTMGYTYDKVGNRLTKTLDAQIDSYVYDTGTNRLSQITGANPQTFSFDANGNTIFIDSKALIYNQNNRLIQATENSTTLAEYVYNGNGQRVKKAAGGDTTIYHYDYLGNLIGESTPSGGFVAEYVYLNNMRLSAIAAQEITVHVFTILGGNLSGVPLYAFTEAGTYTGKSATTDEDGMARFEIADFSDGTYKFRADYLSYQFWSDVITIPGTCSTIIEIPQETATARVIQGDTAKAGINVYLFNESGSYLGLYGTTDENGQVTFNLPASKDFKFRADNLGSQFWSEVVTILSGGPNDIEIDMGGGTLTVAVDQGEGTPLSDIHVYLFRGDGTAYLGLSDQTDVNGEAAFEVCSGTYNVRADYMGYQFWGLEKEVTGNDSLPISIPHADVTVTVQGDFDTDLEAREDLNVYLFTSAGTYLGEHQTTDSQGQVTFNVPEMDYKVRADYMTQQYWSFVFNWTDETVTIEEGLANVTMTHMGLPAEGVNVYVFSSAGTYLGLFDVTDQDGLTSFRLPSGDYNFRGDYQGSQYWSGNSTLIPHVGNPVTISAGGGAFELTVRKGQDDPMEGVHCYLFSGPGSYLGEHQVTSREGEVVFNLADGGYNIRIDYLGYQFWTDVFTVPDTLSMAHTIAHQDVLITVEGDYNGDVQARTGLNVYLFTPSGSYLGQFQTTDAQGQVSFNLPEQDYKVRADYMTKQYWSSVFTWTDEAITINEGTGEVHVATGASPIENVPVYVFNDLGTYLGIHDQTDENGIVSFRLAEGTYKFRAHHMSSHYWATEPVNAHQVNVINVNTGGGIFDFTVEKAAGVPFVGVPVYVFTSGGSYLGMTSQTDDQGQVSFDLSDGDYKFRADYLGYQFWSGVSTVPMTLSDVLMIAHQDVTVTVENLYQAPFDPIEGVRVYLFKESGSYLGQYGNTNAQGQVAFSLPEQRYKVRADYMGYQFWSDPFVWSAAAVTINHGLAKLHVIKGGADVVDAPVYLFKASGSYLGKSERTDSGGVADFLLPDQQYKFRVDYEGSQYWSDVVTIMPHEENNIELDLDLLALDLTNDPNPVRFHAVPPEFRAETWLWASLRSMTRLFVQSALAQTAGGDAIYYYINHHLGTPQKVVDESGMVLWSADYKPFGDADVTVSTVQNSFRSPGQYYDQETRLHYNWHRYYRPWTGRYLTPDPSGMHRGQNQLYVFAENNPNLFVDPFGLWPHPFNLFCILKHRAAKKACGPEYQKAMEEFNRYVDWCECAFWQCQCPDEYSCSPAASQSHCSKIARASSPSAARYSCIRSPNFERFANASINCIRKIAAYLKCLSPI
ncbi:MAG: RHS repeat-associated core domain-containing protein [Thermodesulfobacteriota bacterium]|nr:RHS repeat-associated core domain-containing protein [Thermodesulfobacteriota bacterium]